MTDEMHDGLNGPHRHELTVESLISKEVLKMRGYRTVKAHELPPEFADYQRRDGLLIPLRSVRGEIESYQLKPNQPRTGKNGKPIKYETAANAPQVLDVPAAAIPHLGDPSIPLLITEGAKKVDSAVSHGFLSTIGLQGVYGWRGKNEKGGSTALADWEDIALKDRKVIIAFDSDVMAKDTVRSALDRLGDFLKRRGARLQYIVMPDLPNGSKCGLDDWFASDNHENAIAALDALAALAVTELPELAVASPVAGVPRANILRMSEVEAKEIDWLWPQWIPKGKLSLLGGYAGDGKSTFTTSLVASLTTGAPLPDGTVAPITNCLMLPAEDDASHVVKPLLAAHGADMDRTHVWQTVTDPDGTVRPLDMRRDLDLVAKAVQEHEIGLIVIDPISGFTPGADRNSEGETRDSLQQLIPVMEAYQCAILGVMHIGKNSGHARSYQSVMGSSAFTAVARSVLMLSNLPMTYQVEGEPQRKVVGVSKSNYAVAPHPIQFMRPRDEALQFLGDSPVGLDAALNAKPGGEDDAKGPTETQKAEEWLLEFMDGKRMLASEVEAAAKEEGFSKTTLHKARTKLNVGSDREGSQWIWSPASADISTAA